MFQTIFRNTGGGGHHAVCGHGDALLVPGHAAGCQPLSTEQTVFVQEGRARGEGARVRSVDR